MTMDVYHKVLHKLYEMTEGNKSKAVDFRDLVKKLGFQAHYAEIFKLLSGEGWIVETAKADFVNISHWGIAEVKKTSAPPLTSVTEDTSTINSPYKKDVARALAASRELTILLETFMQNAKRDDFSLIEKKLAELGALIQQTKIALEK